MTVNDFLLCIVTFYQSVILTVFVDLQADPFSYSYQSLLNMMFHTLVDLVTTQRCVGFRDELHFKSFIFE